MGEIDKWKVVDCCQGKSGHFQIIMIHEGTQRNTKGEVFNVTSFLFVDRINSESALDGYFFGVGFHGQPF
jgi:hypothetical protein